MAEKLGVVIAMLTVIFVLLSVALIDGTNEEDQTVFGRTIMPLSTTITPAQPNCQDYLWGKTIVRRCE